MKVLLKKDYTQWNWEVIQELIEGPLGNPVHFNTPNTVKFVKKVLSFYSPSSQSFALLPCCRVIFCFIICFFSIFLMLKYSRRMKNTQRLVVNYFD